MCDRLINVSSFFFPRPCWRQWPPSTSRSTRARCCRPSERATTSTWPARTSSTRRPRKPPSPRCSTSSSPAWRTRPWVSPQTSRNIRPQRGLDLTSSFFLIDASFSSSSSSSSFRTLAYKSQDQLVYGVQKAWPSGKEQEGLPWVCLIWFFFFCVCLRICFIFLSFSLFFSILFLSVSDVCLLCLFIFLPAVSLFCPKRCLSFRVVWSVRTWC